jgi:hypothetical protein
MGGHEEQGAEMKIALKLKTQCWLLLALALVWVKFAAIINVGLVVEWHGLLALAIAMLIAFALPLSLLLLGVSFIIREAHQRFDHPFLFYMGVATSFLPFVATTLQILFHVYSSN